MDFILYKLLPLVAGMAIYQIGKSLVIKHLRRKP
jgi:hypothetical protein